MTPLFPRERFYSSTGMQLTQGMFYEYKSQGTEEPMYTLKEQDVKGCLSMYKIYMECESEYEAAIKLLGSWTHWKKLTSCNWFKPYVEAWREEREIKEAAIGKATIIEQAAAGNVAAAKELVNQVKVKKSAGRPSKKQQEEYASKMSSIDQKVVSILERAGSV